MLFWEVFIERAGTQPTPEQVDVKRAVHGPRLPFDKRCAALTKSGARCRGKIHAGLEFCPFHDPNVATQRSVNAAKGTRTRRRLTHLPGGYLRPLRSRAAVGQSMDRLYRQLLVGDLTVDMGKVLFDILSRILDSGLDGGKEPARPLTGRSKAERLRPKVNDLLTRSEKIRWRKAVENAPADYLIHGDGRPHAETSPATINDKSWAAELA